MAEFRAARTRKSTSPHENNLQRLMYTLSENHLEDNPSPASVIFERSSRKKKSGQASVGPGMNQILSLNMKQGLE